MSLSSFFFFPFDECGLLTLMLQVFDPQEKLSQAGVAAGDAESDGDE